MRNTVGGRAKREPGSSLSFGLSVSAARRFRTEHYLYVSLGHVWHGQDSHLGLELKDQQTSLLLAWEWRYAAHCAWVVQLLNSSAAGATREPFDEDAFEVGIGWKTGIRVGTVLELGLIENLFNADNTPDFGLHFGIRHGSDRSYPLRCSRSLWMRSRIFCSRLSLVSRSFSSPLSSRSPSNSSSWARR